MGLYDELLEEARDEITARNNYHNLADRLRQAGHYDEASAVDRIASDEDKHANSLMTLASSVLARESSGEIKLSGEMIEVPLTPSLGLVSHTGAREVRPVPKTYGDWVNLAEDIKSADPSSWTVAWVNDALVHISEEDSAAEGSKRKLLQRAGELGIK